MTELSEDFDEAVNTKELDAILAVERVYGTVQCNACRYWGRMDGYIEPADLKIIKFICPKCSVVESVKNPEAL